MVWHDELDILDDVAVSALSTKTPPIVNCCSEPEVHIHAHRGWGKHTDRGSAWIWCSHCGLFSHLDGIHIHQDWENNSEVDFSKVTAVPKYLEAVKKSVDKHFKEFINA